MTPGCPWETPGSQVAYQQPTEPPSRPAARPGAQSVPRSPLTSRCQGCEATRPEAGSAGKGKLAPHRLAASLSRPCTFPDLSFLLSSSWRPEDFQDLPRTLYSRLMSLQEPAFAMPALPGDLPYLQRVRNNLHVEKTVSETKRIFWKTLNVPENLIKQEFSKLRSHFTPLLMLQRLRKYP